MSRAGVSACGLVLLLAVSCASLESLSPARRGETRAFRAALVRDRQAGRLDREGVWALAEAVAQHELRAAQGASAVQRVQQARVCARQLEGVLEERASRPDAASSFAAMALLNAGRGDPEAWRVHLQSADAGWRAVAARTLTSADLGAERRACVLDPDENVRLAAVIAAEEARDSLDAETLVEAARLDPSRLVRVRAVRAIAGLGSPTMVSRLRDLWSAAPEPVQQAIVSAWAWPEMMLAGGDRELAWAAGTQQGAVSVIAAGVLLRHGAPEHAGLGTAALARCVRTCAPRDRALAISMAPLSEAGLRALVDTAAEQEEPTAKVAALVRLSRDDAGGRKVALDKLQALAASDRPGHTEAQEAMARAGDMRVRPLLVALSRAPTPNMRRRAADLLVELGAFADAAWLLADADADVRTAAACSILAAR